MRIVFHFVMVMNFIVLVQNVLCLVNWIGFTEKGWTRAGFCLMTSSFDSEQQLVGHKIPTCPKRESNKRPVIHKFFAVTYTSLLSLPSKSSAPYYCHV